MKEYIHYGHNKFDRKKFISIKNEIMFTKPTGGLWASDVNAEYSWKDWCENEGFKLDMFDKSFTFTLLENSNVITIRSMKDLENIPRIPNPVFLSQAILNKENMLYFIDFEKILKEGVDAIEYFESDWNLHMAMYGWDYDSILIMNPDVIRLKE